MWKKLSHPNILPFRGVDTAVFQLALVYDWGQGGNIAQYLTMHPRGSRPSLVGKTFITVATMNIYQLYSPAHYEQLHDVTKGLKYLHDLDITHGNLKKVGFLSDPSIP